MKLGFNFLLLSFLACALPRPSDAAGTRAASYVRVVGGRFERNNRPYAFLGTNYWYGMNLASTGPGGDRARLLRELDHLASIGVKNLRILAASEGPGNEPYRMHPALQNSPGAFDETLLKGLDFLLSEMGKRDMVAVIMLNNFWPWSGGMAQYLQWAGAGKIPYPPPAPGGNWDTYMQYTAKFYANRKARDLADNVIRHIVRRTNTVTGVAYRNDPTIMAWELCNEPRGMRERVAYNKWIDETSTLIRSMDPNHLITTGSEGDTPDRNYAGIDFLQNHSFKNIDYATAHIWIENWGWYNPKAADLTFPMGLSKAKAYLKTHVDYAAQLRKPLVLEEFGIARDNRSYDFRSPVKFRDRYYDEMFKSVEAHRKAGALLSGVAFWAWSGEGRAENPGGLWRTGNSWVGDPPHEHQGWYGIYNTDASTIDVLKRWVGPLER